MSSINKTIIGIDVSKDKLDLSGPGGHEEIANTSKAIESYFKQALKGGPITQVVLESTGGYERCCVRVLDKLGIPFHVAHPNAVYHFAKSKRLLAKSDKIDAGVLRLFGEECELAPTELKSREQEALERLVRRQQQLVETLTGEKLRLSGPCVEGESRRSMKRIIKCLAAEIKRIDQKLEEGIAGCEVMQEKIKRLETFKGMGHKTAVTMVLSLPELGQTGRSNIASLLGLAPMNKDSGKRKGYRAIQGGRFHARKALYMPALSATRHNPAMKAFYERLRAQGKTFKVAIVAVMRKMVITLNAMLRDGNDWQAVGFVQR